MFQAFGLYSHIQANRLRTVCLIVGFVALLHVLVFSLLIIVEALTGGGDVSAILNRAGERFLATWPLSFVLAVGWFVIAYVFHQRMINAAVGARGVSRSQEPRLYDALETLCISRGLPTPRLQIMETPALNAFASGISDRNYTVTVTRGLLEELEPDELEAVLAHELTHIRNRDTQLMVVAQLVDHGHSKAAQDFAQSRTVPGEKAECLVALADLLERLVDCVVDLLRVGLTDDVE